MTKTYTLYIDAYTPGTIPMARLARYMQNLAEMLGHETDVHFDTLREGSTQLVSRIDHEAVPKVAKQLALVRQGEGAPAAMKAKMEIDDLLAGDNATGFIYEGNDEAVKVILFPGVTKPKPTTYGPFNQEGSLDGVLISVGGADETVHIQLQNGNLKYTGIQTNRETARRLAKHMYEPVRLFGTGRWLRDEQGNWVLKSFKVRQDFKVLKSDSLKDVIDQMRGVEGSEWKSMDDPIGALRALRDNGDGLH
ncbi:MAG: hypothetical protein CVT70_08625 [Alphaproteobacteria bacterium HGW-Alphaproteobacteria-1]|jgi:hypothetical protein|nr:MAG: hypothetical protein CVT70_08625 [Alphaproteobacteria bacterium HGW-Alphaproteobacteria-1]